MADQFSGAMIEMANFAEGWALPYELWLAHYVTHPGGGLLVSACGRRFLSPAWEAGSFDHCKSCERSRAKQCKRELHGDDK